MLRRLLPTICFRPPAGQKQQTRSSTYFCFDSAMPVIPACFWSTLGNGFRVVTEQTAGPLACVTLIAEAGPRYETACNNGASHFFEHMAFRGLCSLPRCPFQELIREIGAHMTVHTDREYQAFVCTCPHEAVACIINLFARIFCELECNDDEMEAARKDVYTQLTEMDVDYKYLCMDYLHQTAFQGTPLAYSPIGPLSNYKRFDRGFLAAFVAQNYQPFRLVLSVSSIHNHNDILCRAQKEFEGMERTTNELVYWPCRYTGSMLRFRDDSAPFCHIAIAMESCGYMGKDFMSMQLMKHIIGRWNETQCQGYNTWPMLAHASAISKLCYSFESFYIPYRDIGLFGVYFVIKKEDDFEDAILMIQDQWMNMCTVLSPSEVARAASSLKVELAKAVDGCVATCLDMGLQIMYKGNRRNLVELYDQLDNIKQMELRDVANDMVYDRCVVVSAIGPTEGVPDYNRIRSGMYWLRV